MHVYFFFCLIYIIQSQNIYDSFLFIGDLSGAEQAICRASELGGADCASNERKALKSLQRLHDDAQRAMEAGDHRRVVFCMDRCLEYSPSNSK